MNQESVEYVDIIESQAPALFSKTIRRIIAEENLAEVNSAMPLIVPRDTIYTRYVKRFLDIVLSFLALIVSSPVNLILMICTIIDVGFPIIFQQERLGKDMQPFTLFKFRNMNNKTNENGELLPARLRVSGFGRFVRRTSLDELLNFWSILKGDMSIIGPRPLVEPYVYSMTDRHRQRYLVRPGLECPFRPGVHKFTWKDQFENDVWYVENISFKTDVKMVFWLLKAVFDRRSTAIRANALKGSFMGYEKNGDAINSHRIPAYYVRKAELIYDSEERDSFSGYSYRDRLLGVQVKAEENVPGVIPVSV